MKTIKKHIIISSILIVTIPTVILCILSVLTSYYVSVNLTENSLESIAENAAQRAQWEIQSFVNVSAQAGTMPELSDPNSISERKLSVLAKISNQYGFQRGNLIDSEGNGIDGNTYTERQYFQEAMKGNTFVSDPLVSKVTGKLTIIVAAPLWKGGVYGSEPVGCVYFVPNEEFLNDIVRNISVSENSASYIINKDGSRIADEDIENVKQAINYINDANEDSKLAQLAQVHQKMTAGEKGFSRLRSGDGELLIGYAPIPNSNGWSLAVTAPSSDFLKDTYYAIVAYLVLLAAAITISLTKAGKMGKRIGDPVAQCTERIRLLSQGDLTSPVPSVNTKDETKILADATEMLVNDMNCIIGDIGRMLSSMAKGNFDVESGCGEGVYHGDFHLLIESVKEINQNLTGTLYRINSSADQVSTGSDQVSGGAQSLSQGATEQAASIEELASTIHTILERVTATSERCENGSRLVEETAEHIGTATDEMKKLTEAMKDISDAAGEISKIIMAIEDIAFQTNILALNAAVEAARAGDAGKGFAVVADEVRNLASKSADAVHDTTVLIEKAVAAVEKGTSITAETSLAVSGVEERSAKVRRIVEDIAHASAEQKDMINQVSVGIEQISNVVQTNTATAEQSAAASEELSGQAMMLKQLVGGFKLRNRQ